MYRLLRFFLFLFPAELMHRLGLRVLDCLYPIWRINKVRAALPQKPVEVFGLHFPNPVGLAAGLDKDGQHIDALFGLGFGFVEVGAVTLRAQPGNPQPRLFRLPEKQALINRFGFNNLGVDQLVARLKARKVVGIVGVNLGKNASTPLECAIEEYCCCYHRVYPVADFVTLNISSPNTLGLRSLQGEQYLRDLLQRVKQQQLTSQQKYSRYVPFLVKVSPDLTPAEITAMALVFQAFNIDGIIASNTTQDRDMLGCCKYAGEAGGLSGRPLREKTLEAVKHFYRETNGTIPIIAVGGIASSADATALLAAGASLVQLYTGLIYQGPALVTSIINEI